MNSKDLKILEKLKTGNPSGYKELFDLYYMPLSIHSLKYCNLFELAQDIVQDLFVKFWDEKIYMKLDEANSPYLFKSIKNNTLQVIKKIRREDLIRHDKFILSAQARGATNAQPFPCSISYTPIGHGCKLSFNSK